MAKLYRVVPDSISTTLTTGYLSDSTEDLLYKLGYLGYGNHDVNYFGTYEVGKGKLNESTKDYIYFFNSPWSCFRALKFLNDPYGNMVARILEYDIPDNIVNNSKKIFTNYTNYQAKGRKILVKQLNMDKENFTEFNDELKSKLKEFAIQDIKESIEIFAKSAPDIYKNKKNFNSDFMNQWCFEPSRIQRIINRKLDKKANFFKTDIITGNSMIITRKDTELVEDIIYSQRTIDDLAEIIEKSNGILTLDNFKEGFDMDISEYSYGPILD